MIERLALFLVIAGGLLAGYVLLRRWQLGRAARLVRVDPLLAGVQAGVPLVMYFSSPQCAPCQFQQKPALDQLRADLGLRVQVVEVNTLEQPESARRWGILSVPTTIVLDGAGQPYEINYGVVGVDKLRTQVQRIA